MNVVSARFVQYFLGLLIKTFGLSMIIQCNLGTGAWEAFYVGLAEKFGYSVGLWIFIVGFFLIVINAGLWRRKPTYTSFITISIVSLFIDWWLALLQVNPSEISMQILVFWTGLITASIGAAIYLLSDFTPTPVDQLMFALAHRFHVPIMLAKTIGEFFAFVVALSLHGTIGIGTIMFTLLFGPLIQFFMGKLQYVLEYKEKC